MRSKQLGARHVFVASIAGIAIVLAAGAITYLFTRPHGSSEWADVIRSIVLAVAAMGAVPAAYVAYRKQQTTEAEHVLELAKEDRRRDELTESSSRADRQDFRVRFTGAAGQIGSDKAPVRLAGVYAMAQLADEWGRVEPEQRQMCIAVLCAYLRMPWPARPDVTSRRADMPRRLAGHSASAPAGNGTDRIRDEESKVRETILRVIADHVHKDRSEDHWHDNDFDFSGSELPAVDLDVAEFRGRVDFTETTFTGGAWFVGATFATGFSFQGATFTGHAHFGGATFTGQTWFDRATFTGDARFDRATFTGNARFDGATFTGNAWFDRATFTRDAWFDDATFTGDTLFARATFTRDASFGDATFTRDAWFGGATFTRDARFEGATFTVAPIFDGAMASGLVGAPDGSRSEAIGVPRPLGPLLGFPDEPE